MAYIVKVLDVIRLSGELFKVEQYLPTSDRVRLRPVMSKHIGRGQYQYTAHGTPRWFDREELKSKAEFVGRFEEDTPDD